MEEAKTMARHLQINYRPSHKDKSLGLCFAMGYYPPAAALEKYGNLYIYFQSEPSSQQIKSQEIITACGKAFYQKSDNPISFRLKMALRALNEIVSKHQGNYSIAVMAIHQNTLLFAHTKSTKIVLARDGKSKVISSGANNTLSEITEGKINASDRILITGSILSDSLGDKALKNLATLKSTQDIKAMLQKILKLPEAVPYSLLIIDNQPIKQAETAPTREPQAIKDASGDKSTKQDLPARILASLSGVLITAKSKFKSSAKQTRHKYLPNFLSKAKRAWTEFWTKYVNPNPKQAIIVVIITTIIIVGILFISVSQLGKSSDPKKQLESAAMLVDSANEAVSKNNQQSARDYITKTKAILNKIPQNYRQSLDDLAETKKIKRGYTQTIQDIQAIEDRLDNITRINPTNSFEIGSNKLSAMVYTADHLYGIDSDNGSVLDINPLFGSPVKKAENADLKGSYSTADLADSGFVALGNTNLWQYTPVSGLIQLKASSLPKSSAVASYLNNLYLLSPSEGQIVRYTKSGNNLTSRTNMLRNVSSGELDGTSSMAVFGNIFIAKNKSILLFEQGEERSFRINNMPDNFGGIKSIYYNTAGNYFLALNSSSTRIAQLILDSESANFKKSYALPADAIISSFTLDPKTSQIFVNSGSKIISFNLVK